MYRELNSVPQNSCPMRNSEGVPDIIDVIIMNIALQSLVFEV